MMVLSSSLAARRTLLLICTFAHIICSMLYFIARLACRTLFAANQFTFVAFCLQDIASKYAAVLFGTTNALSSLLGSAAVYTTGRVLDESHSWSAVFDGVAACYIAGAVVYLNFASAEQQFE